MKKIRVAVNGFGRIGRLCTRFLTENNEVEIVAINDLSDSHTLAHLFKFDTAHGRFAGDVSHEEGVLRINGNSVRVLAEKDPALLPWNELQIDVVVESTGRFRTLETASKHIEAGAGRVIISAPASGGGVKSIVRGINDDILDGTEEVISNASCTTNCVAPMVKIIDELCGIKSGFITTVHSYTGDQRLQDSPHKDLRRARAAAVNIVPTTTGAANAIGNIFPELKGKLAGTGIRVPVINGSLTELTCVVNDPASIKAINQAFTSFSEDSLKGILEVENNPIVSSDIIGNRHSCVVDSALTTVLENSVKVVGWYDNESGYSARLAELVVTIAASSPNRKSLSSEPSKTA